MTLDETPVEYGFYPISDDECQSEFAILYNLTALETYCYNRN